MKAIPKLLLVFSLAAGLGGCAGVVIGGAAAGATVAHDRRTSGAMYDDEVIELNAGSAIRQNKELADRIHINITSYNKIVLLTGEAPTEDLRRQAEEAVRGVSKVRRIYNEMTVAAPSSMMSRSSDTVITGSVKTALLGIEDHEGFDALHVKVVTENGTVYLMGLVTREEGNAAAEAARQVSGVQRVVKLFEYVD
jgi:osmotically-inducible protein OsmY